MKECIEARKVLEDELSDEIKQRKETIGNMKADLRRIHSAFRLVLKKQRQLVAFNKNLTQILEERVYSGDTEVPELENRILAEQNHSKISPENKVDAFESNDLTETSTKYKPNEGKPLRRVNLMTSEKSNSLLDHRRLKHLPLHGFQNKAQPGSNLVSKSLLHRRYL